MWCIVSSITFSASASCNTTTRTSGPRSRLNGSRASSIARRRVSASRSFAGSSRRSITRSGKAWWSAICCHGVPAVTWKVVRKISWRLTISLIDCSSAAMLSFPINLTATAMLYRGWPGSNWSRNHIRCCAKESDGLVSGSRRGIPCRVATSLLFCLRRRVRISSCAGFKPAMCWDMSLIERSSLVTRLRSSSNGLHRFSWNQSV